MPFAFMYGDDVYIHDVIFNKGDKLTTQPVVVGRTRIHMPHKERYEANNGGAEYADTIDQSLRKDGVRINITARRAPNNQSKMGAYHPALTRYKEILFCRRETPDKRVPGVYGRALHLFASRQEPTMTHQIH